MFLIFFLALSRRKWLKLVLFRTKLGTRYYLVQIIVLKLLESKKVVICLKLRAKLLFKIFFNFFRTFSHKVVQTLFFDNKQGTEQYLVYIIVLK